VKIPFLDISIGKSGVRVGGGKRRRRTEEHHHHHAKKRRKTPRRNAKGKFVKG